MLNKPQLVNELNNFRPLQKVSCGDIDIITLSKSRRSRVYKVIIRDFYYVLKEYDDNYLSKKEYFVMNDVYNHYESKSLIGVPRPLFHIDNMNLVVMEGIEAESLTTKLSKLLYLPGRLKSINDIMIKLSEWLLHFQSLDKITSKYVNKYDRNNIDLDVLTYKGLKPYLPIKQLDTIYEILSSINDSHPPVNQVYCHKDFTPWNVLCNGENIYVIDFESCCISDLEFDISKFTIMAEISSILSFNKTKLNISNIFLKRFTPSINIDIFNYWRLFNILRPYKKMVKFNGNYKQNTIVKMKLNVLNKSICKILKQYL